MPCASRCYLPDRVWHITHRCHKRLRCSEPERLASYRALFTARIDDAVLADIRTSTHKGLALGSERFKD
jgi:putative transposase